MISPLTPLDFMARSVHAWRDLTAVVEGDRRFTYAEFGARVERQAAALRQLGVQPGDRVAVLATESAVAMERHFAPMRIGPIRGMLNTRLPPAELAWILRHCGAKVLLADPQLAPSIAGAGVPHVIEDYEGFLGGAGPCPAPFPVTDENACIAINYTSGTTGFPKGVMFTHRGAWTNAIGEIVEHGLTQRSVYLWTLRLFHSNKWCFSWASTASPSAASPYGRCPCSTATGGVFPGRSPPPAAVTSACANPTRAKPCASSKPNLSRTFAARPWWSVRWLSIAPPTA